jgi:uncharacterized 2Fe-2S/4Fe-4S cluster protein (DUF4445 family)
MDDKIAKIIFQPSGRRGEVPADITIIEASRKLGADIEALCGEKKVCGKCKVRIEEGYFEKYGVESKKSNVSEWQEEEEKYINAEDREAGFRLGCVAKVQGDLLVFVPEESRAGKQVVSKAARDIHIDHDPAVKLYYVEVEKPSFEEPTGDFERICAELEKQYGLKDLRIDIQTLRQLPGALRKGGWKATVSVWMDQEVIRVQPGQSEANYGLAIDIGTTTVAAYFCNLATMEVLDTVSMMNPQCKYGEDVMSRITYHMMNEGGLETMSDDIIAALNTLIEQAVTATHPPRKKVKKKKGEEGPDEFIEVPEEGKSYLRLAKEDIEDVTLGCNTAMHHILLKLDPEHVGMAPFPPVIHHSLDIRARDLGININPSSYVFPPVIHHSLDIRARDLGININPSSYVYILPNEAGFVGADNVGVLIAEEPYNKEEIQLIIDIGTNGELVLGNKEKLISSSCATGPALEGAQLAYGMRAAPGAMERIKIDPETHEVDYKTCRPKGFAVPEFWICWRSFIKPVLSPKAAYSIKKVRSQSAFAKTRIPAGRNLCWPGPKRPVSIRTSW